MNLQHFLLCLLCVSTIQAGNDFEFTDLLESLSNEDISIVTLAEEIVAYYEDEDLDSIGDQCLEDLRDIVGLNETWILSLIDSSGKIPHGILRMNSNSVGQYQQCIDTVIREGRIRVTGQHCMLRVSLAGNPRSPTYQIFGYDRRYRRDFLDLMGDSGINNHGEESIEYGVGILERGITLNIGICVPSSCNAKSLNAVIKMIRESNNTVANLPVNLTIQEPTCTTEKKFEQSTGDGVTIYFFATIGFIMLLSTLHDLWYQFIEKGDIKDQNQLLVAFSVYSNTNRLFTPSKNPGPLASLHGIRVLSLFWVVLGHRYSVTPSGPMENLAAMFEWFSDFSSTIITGGTVAVDSFFLMSGVLLSYSFFRSAKIKNTLRDLPLFYVHRILRLTPLLAVVVLIYATLLRHYGNGPKQHVIKSILTDECRENWWKTLLYIQNYVGGPSCVGQSWYLAVDMQLYVISPLLLYPLLMHKTIGIIWVSFCIFIAQATAFVISYLYKWPAVRVQSLESSYQSKFYHVSHCRATPYFIGLFAGYLMVKSFQKNNITTSQYNFLKSSVIVKVLVIFGWLISLTMLGLVLFGNYDFFQLDYEPTSHWADTLYIAFSRTGWALGLLWIIVACAYGYGGPVNWFLSLPVFEILGRFSYAVYLTHMGIQLCLLLTANYIRLFTHFNVVMDFFGDLVLSFSISYILILSFESPITIIEKVLFKRNSEKPKNPASIRKGNESALRTQQAGNKSLKFEEVKQI